MTRALVWKEVREQWAVWLVLALVATGAAAGLFTLFAPGPNRDEMLTAVLWLTAWGYGLVCGALLLAGETEGATQPFLDSLPGTRPRIWRVKAATGLALLAAQFAALVAIGFLLFRERSEQSRLGVDLAGMLISGVVGYAWGLYCGSSAANVLGAIARGMMLQAAWAVGLYAAVSLAQSLSLRQHEEWSPGPIILGLMALTASGVVVRSRTIYCEPDRLRAAALKPPRRMGWWTRRVHELWEACREARWFALGMAAYGLAGVAALVLVGTAFWPVLTLVIGVFCGLTAFTGERGWMVRATVRSAIGVAGAGIAAVVALGVFARLPLRGEVESTALEAFFRDRVAVSAVSALASNPTLFSAFWLVLGFACGLPAGLLFRKRLSAALAGLGLACVFGGVWLPTVYVGGEIPALAMWAVPALFLAATLLLAYLRSAGRLTAVGAAVVAGCVLVTAASGTAAALWHRATEMPPAPDAVDLAAFSASLPSPEENRGGSAMSDALLRLTLIGRDFDRQPPLTPRDPRQPPERRSFLLFRGYVEKVTVHGWKAAEPDLGPFLDSLFRDTWARDLAAAADLPAGSLINLREVSASAPFPQLQASLMASAFLTARGLQRQADGKPEEFVDDLRTGLGVVRNIRHTHLATGAVVNPSVEAPLTRGVERWLERLDGRPDLLRQALAVLLRHLDEPPADPEMMRQVDCLLFFNSLADPANISRSGNGTDPFFPGAFNDGPLLRLAASVPWERIRYRRVLEGLESDDTALQRRAKELASPLVRSVRPTLGSSRNVRLTESEPRHLYRCRVAALQVALRLYQEEVGRPAERLDELVPKYLPAVPLDPYDGQPFRYRLSRGEALDWPPDQLAIAAGKPYQPRQVPAGQGILWSVGYDRTDGGGHIQEWPDRTLSTGKDEDLIALVPLPPSRP